MSDVQVVPPFAGATFRRRGRVYTAPTTDSIAMPLADAAIAEGHGWQVVAGWYAPKETAGGGASPAGSNGDVQVKSGSGFAALGFTPLANTAAAINAALGYEPANLTFDQTTFSAGYPRFGYYPADPNFPDDPPFNPRIDGPFQVVASVVAAESTSLPEMISAAADRDFSSNSGHWTGTGWTIAGGKATAVAGANNFALTASAISPPPVSGKFYRVVFTITTTTASESLIYWEFAGGYSELGTSIGTETVTITIQASVDPNYAFDQLVFWLEDSDHLWAGSVDSISIKEVPVYEINTIRLAQNQGFFMRATGQHAINMELVANSVDVGDDPMETALIKIKGNAVNGGIGLSQGAILLALFNDENPGQQPILCITTDGFSVNSSGAGRIGINQKTPSALLHISQGDTTVTSGLKVDAEMTADLLGGVIFTSSDPHKVGAWWDNAGTLTKSAG